MNEFSFYVLIIALVVAVGMQIYSILKIQEIYRKTKGVIQYRNDLLVVKEVINLNMKSAVAYIALSILLFLTVIIFFINGRPKQGLAIMFLFGIVTLPIGLIGKYFENKIRSMDVQSNDPNIKETFKRYLVQWKQARFKLPD